MHCMHFRHGVFSLSLCLVSTLPLWWADGCELFPLQIPSGFQIFPKCLDLLYFQKVAFIFIFMNLSLMLANKQTKIEIFHWKLFLLSFSEIHQSYRFTLLCVSWRCQMALHPIFLLSFEISIQILNIHMNRLVYFFSQNLYQLKHGIYINRPFRPLRQDVKIPDSHNPIEIMLIALFNLERKSLLFGRKKSPMVEDIEKNVKMCISSFLCCSFL